MDKPEQMASRAGSWCGTLIVAALMTCTGPAWASCMDEVQQLTQRLGLSPNAVAPSAELPATTESRGIPAGGNPIAVRRSEALAALQSARAASAQGNEQECAAQLDKARSIFQERQP